jgi:hypothetical protein
MEGENLTEALARIDAALARLDRVAARPQHSAQQSDSELAAKHEQLRAAAAKTLRQLDALIGEKS